MNCSNKLKVLLTIPLTSPFQDKISRTYDDVDYVIRELEIRSVYGRQGMKFSGVEYYYERSELLIYDGEKKRRKKVRKKKSTQKKSAVADRGGAITGPSYT